VPVSGTYILSGDQTPSKGRVGNNFDSKLTGRVEDVDFWVFDVKREGRILHLDGSNGVHFLSPTQSVRRAFRQPEIFHFPLPSK
jgi:hypothetical protein